MPREIGLMSRYRYWVQTKKHQWHDRADDIPPGAEIADLARDKHNYVGLSRHTSLKTLVAHNVDQGYLEEISLLPQLDFLDLAHPVRATDLAPLRRLKRLRVLKIDSPTKITDFTPICDLPMLRVLFISSAQHMTTLDWLRPLKEQLTVLGIESSGSRPQRIPSLRPLEGFTFEALLLAGAALGDKDLSPLTTCPNLVFLHGARLAPRAEFEALAAAMPGLHCDRFNPSEWL